jgi:hypothetical protein
MTTRETSMGRYTKQSRERTDRYKKSAYDRIKKNGKSLSQDNPSCWKCQCMMIIQIKLIREDKCVLKKY